MALGFPLEQGLEEASASLFFSPTRQEDREPEATSLKPKFLRRFLMTHSGEVHSAILKTGTRVDGSRSRGCTSLPEPGGRMEISKLTPKAGASGQPRKDDQGSDLGFIQECPEGRF